MCGWVGRPVGVGGSGWEGPNRFGQCRDRGVCVKVILSSMFDDFSMPSLNCSTMLCIFDVGVYARFRCSSYWLSCVSVAVAFSASSLLVPPFHWRIHSTVLFREMLWILIGVVVVSGRPRVVRRHYSSRITDLLLNISRMSSSFATP